MDKINIKEKINASLVLGSYLDTLGFNNGLWEFNFGIKKINTLKDALLVNYEIIHHFFALGGFNIDMSRWNASDDTIMMIATMKACKKGGTIDNFIDEYVKILPLLEDSKRVSGNTTLISLRLLAKYKSMDRISYSNKMGGNGAAMRTHYIGIHFTDINKIIEVSIMASRLTHNYPLGFLGGMVTALFTHYAINNIHPEKWCEKLLELNENNTINKIIEKLPIYKEYLKNKDEFWTPWYKYKEYRLPNYDIKSSDFMFGSERFASLIDILYENKNYVSGTVDFDHFGFSGVSATIIAYDSILMSIQNKKINWESLVINSTLHFGDSDTIGTIAGCWYGAVMGFSDVDKDVVNMLEFRKELI